MAKTKRKNSGDFDAILAGFGQQPAKKAAAYQARRPEPQAQRKPTSSAPRSENSVRRLFKNISYPWPTKISGFMWSPGRRPQDTYDETLAETKPAPRVDPPQSETPQAKVEPPKPPKTEDEAIAEELGLSPDLGAIDLKRIRRDFAKKNHPDRFEPPERSSAERRMSIANMLIDELMRQSRSPR